MPTSPERPARRLALIPARGGSKRLARKNIAPFMGRPILAHTVAAAYASGAFERVVVSTEDAEIAAVAEACGAAVMTRPPALASDEARVVDVCLHALDEEEAAGRAYDVLACLYATAPLRRADDIVATLALLDADCDFALAVTGYHHTPHQALCLGAGGTLAPMWPALVDKRADALPPLVVDNGSTYAVRVPALRRHRTFYGPGLRGHVMGRLRSIDIDDADDLALARAVAAAGLA